MADRPVQTGEFAPPPPGAPYEVTQPLDLTAQLAAMARAQAANIKAGKPAEAELQPFNPRPEDQAQLPPVHQEVVEGPVVSVSEPNAAERLLEAARAQHADRSHQPAASDTDSPSRGVPRPILDPGKKITGGFGHSGEAQYYAINGNELAALVTGLMEEMKARIANDLRFSMALCYPRIAVRLKLEVESFAENAGVQLDYVKVPEKQTPLEIAKQHADEVCFVLIERKQEFDAAGEPEDPPDRIREALGLPVPRKQTVEGGAFKQVVDIVPEIEESF